MANKKNEDKKIHIETSCGDALPPMEKYSTSNRFLLIFSILAGVVLFILFNMDSFLSLISVAGFVKMCEILANYYLILAGGAMALVTMRVLKRKSLKCIKRWETFWAASFLVTTTIISITGTFWEGEIWRNVQFFGYALSAYFVSCWLGTDDRKPTAAQANTLDTENDQDKEETK